MDSTSQRQARLERLPYGRHLCKNASFTEIIVARRVRHAHRAPLFSYFDVRLCMSPTSQVGHFFSSFEPRCSNVSSSYACVAPDLVVAFLRSCARCWAAGQSRVVALAYYHSFAFVRFCSLESLDVDKG